jgi:hypothetical protein
MSRLSIHRWLPGRAGARSPIAVSQSAYLQFRTATLIAAFFLFFLFTPGDQRRAHARA